MASGSFQPSIPIFFGKNYDDWAFRKIKPTITAKQAWDILETAYQGTSKVILLNCKHLEESLKIYKWRILIQ